MTTRSRDERPGGPSPEQLRAVRLGHGANCSSVGSVVDTLFVSAAVGGAILAAICAAMRDESVTIAGESDAPARAREDGELSGDDPP